MPIELNKHVDEYDFLFSEDLVSDQPIGEVERYIIQFILVI